MKRLAYIKKIEKALKQCEAITGVFGTITMMLIFITICAIENHLIVGIISTLFSVVSTLFYTYYNDYVILLQNKLYDELRKINR